MKASKTNIDMKATGEKLKWYAEKHGYSVKDIQHYLGLSCPQPVYRWYKGIILPSIDNLLRLSELFNVHMEELVEKQNAASDILVDDVDRELLIKRILFYYSKLTTCSIGLSVQ